MSEANSDETDRRVSIEGDEIDPDDLAWNAARKRPVVVDATPMPAPFTVETKEGTMHGEQGDVLIRGIEGELYPCDASIFAETYELVGGSTDTETDCSGEPVEINEHGEPESVTEILAEETGEPKEKFEPDTPVPNDLGDEFVTEGNQAVVQNSLEELDRVEITKMDADALKAYAEVVTSFGYLKDNLEEPERRPNAQLFGVTD